MAIENKSHWVRDVTFDEDRSQGALWQHPPNRGAPQHRDWPAEMGGAYQHRGSVRQLAAQPAQALALIGIVLSLSDLGVTCHRLAHLTCVSLRRDGACSVPLASAVSMYGCNRPTVPYVSNLTGSWMTAEDATNPSYWVRHARHTVRFADGLATILQDPNHILLEVGPGRTLTGLVRQPNTTGAGAQLVATRRGTDL